MTPKEAFFRLIQYTPHAKQKLFHDSEARFRIVAAGARAGKSMAGGAELAWEVMQPNRNIWCVGTQYELSDKEFDWMLSFLSRIPGLLDICKVTTAQRGSRKIVTPWNTYCQTKSTEKPTSLLGVELDVCLLSEASQIARAPWERMLRSRLGSRHGRLMALSTPNADGGLFREFFENGQSTDPEFSDWESWQFSTLDNPTFSRVEWDIAKQELDEKIFQEQYEGKFVSRRGKMFNLSNEHIVSVLPPNIMSEMLLCGFQGGYQNPASCVWVAITKSFEFLVFKEKYFKQIVLEDIVPVIIKENLGTNLSGTIVDHRDTNLLDRLPKMGLTVSSNEEKKFSSKQATLRRLQAIQSIMKFNEGGKTRLHIHASCSELIQDFNECKWPEKQKEELEKAEIELPTTKYLQGILALSYVVAFIEAARGVDIYSLQTKEKLKKG
jgi:hypothetical protein